MTAIRDLPRLALHAPRPTPPTPGGLSDIGRVTTPSASRAPHGIRRVLDITEWYGDSSGGIRTYLQAKGAYLAARLTTPSGSAWRQSLVVPGAHALRQDGPATRLHRIPGPRIPGQAPYRFLLNVRRVRQILAYDAPDLIEVGSPFLVPWVVQRARRGLRPGRDVPLVHFYHAHVPRLFSRPWQVRAAWQYVRALDAQVACTIVTSTYSRRALEAHGLTRLAQIPLGVDLTMFTPARRAHAAATRARLGLPMAPYAVYVGRFAREKELALVLDAWPTLQHATGAALVLMGAGPEERALRAHRAASAVTFLPFHANRADVADVLAASDCVLAPGRIETFGLAALEALASGTPVVSADDGGVVEQVQGSGAGALFAAGEVDAFIGATQAVLQGDRAAWSRRARAYAELAHGWDAVFDRLFAVYESVLAA